MAVKYSGLLKFTDEIKAEINLAADGTVEKAVVIDGDGVETPIGGGTSDFATAEVKVINNTGSAQEFGCPNIYTDGSTEVFVTDGGVGKNTETTITAVLYKGEVEMLIHSLAPSMTATATGDIEISGSSAIISGDGTITISAS